MRFIIFQLNLNLIVQQAEIRRVAASTWFYIIFLVAAS